MVARAVLFEGGAFLAFGGVWRPSLAADDSGVLRHGDGFLFDESMCAYKGDVRASVSIADADGESECGEGVRVGRVQVLFVFGGWKGGG